MKTANYDQPIEEVPIAIYKVGKWKMHCANGYLDDYDGFGHPAKDGLMDMRVFIKPSQRDENGHIPEDATHIIWFNR